MANQVYTYKVNPGKSVEGLICAISAMLEKQEKMDIQRLTDGNSSYTALQARLKGGTGKQLIGMDKAATVRFITISSEKVRIEIGEAKWADKGAVLALSMFVLWPLAITSGIGIYGQMKLPSKIKAAADEYLGEEATIPSENRETTLQSAKEFLSASYNKVESAVDKIANSRAVRKIVDEAPKILSKFFR